MDESNVCFPMEGHRDTIRSLVQTVQQHHYGSCHWSGCDMAAGSSHDGVLRDRGADLLFAAQVDPGALQ